MMRTLVEQTLRMCTGLAVGHLAGQAMNVLWARWLRRKGWSEDEEW